MSITSSPSSSTGGNDANLSLSIPQGGGIATGRHTVKVASNNVSGISISLSVNSDDTASLVNVANPSWSIRSNEKISRPDPDILDNNRWGVALPMDQTSAALYESAITNPEQASNLVFSGLPTKNNNEHALSVASNAHGDFTINTYYGVRVDRPENLLAGDYRADVIYTVITNEVPTPTITSTSSDTYELGSGADSTVTITGTNLASTYKVYIESNADSTKQYDITSTITNLTDTGLTVTIPTDQTNPDLEPGDYTIHVVTQGGEDGIGFTYTEKKALSVYDSVDNVRVDYDENMIPIYYTGNSSTPRWTSLNSTQIEQNTTTWFDYSGSRSNGEVKWANAVTVKDPSKYKDKSLVVDEADILGYWVYIPRYAYMVMRRDAVDKVVTDEEAAAMGGFNIRFETVDDLKKTPAAYPYSSSTYYYYNCVLQSYPGNNESLIDRSAWATHPAFTWTDGTEAGTTELNGFWIGKFETTGSTSQPTVLPNQKHMSQYSGNIGDMYDVAKSMGVADSNNKYGNTTSTSQSNQNNNNLAISTSHMLKNSEWGAVAYLSASKYGAGVNNVQTNSQYQSGSDGNGDSSYGVTGCGPSTSGSTSTYTGTGTLGTNTACNSGDTSRAYNGNKGVLASTTNNVYGVYDMSGGAYEYVMGSRSHTTNTSQSSTSYFSNATKPPYVDLYPDSIFTNSNTYTNNNQCTWATCGGHALYETKNVQPVSGDGQSWGGDGSRFVNSSTPWFRRGGSAYDYSSAGVFYSGGYIGSSYNFLGFRVALLSL